MNKIEIFALLEEVYQESFLDSILTLKENEKEYKKSEFYKTTRIPLIKLYESYYSYKKANYGLIDQLDAWLENIDESIIEEKLLNLINSLKSNEVVQDLMKSFSLEGLKEQEAELEKTFEELKK